MNNSLDGIDNIKPEHTSTKNKNLLYQKFIEYPYKPGGYSKKDDKKYFYTSRKNKKISNNNSHFRHNTPGITRSKEKNFN